MKDAPCGGMKDAPCAPPTAKVTLFGGYQHVDGEPLEISHTTCGFTTIGGYRYVLTPMLWEPSAATEFVRPLGQARATRMVPGRVSGAWYYFSQNSFITGASISPTTRATVAVKTCAQASSATEVGSNCSGDLNQGSFVIDYTFNRHIDMYGGVTFTEANGGLTSGYLEDNNGRSSLASASSGKSSGLKSLLGQSAAPSGAASFCAAAPLPPDPRGLSPAEQSLRRKAIRRCRALRSQKRCHLLAHRSAISSLHLRPSAEETKVFSLADPVPRGERQRHNYCFLYCFLTRVRNAESAILHRI